MFGQGLIKGLEITIGKFFGKKVTEKYPEVYPNLFERFHGSFKLNLNKCIACGICANACPNKVIEITSEKDENNKKKLTGYKVKIGQCLFCGLCVESCPPKALKNSTDFELSCYRREDCTLDLFAAGYREEEPPKPPKAEEPKAAGTAESTES